MRGRITNGAWRNREENLKFIVLKEKGSDCEAGIFFFWHDTDKIRSAKHDRHEVAGFWRCN